MAWRTPSCSTLKVCGIFSILGIIMCTSQRNEFMCLRSECIVEVESCEIWDVGFPKVNSDDTKDSSGMSGKHY
jgi:hypothetical protein